MAGIDSPTCSATWDKEAPSLVLRNVIERNWGTDTPRARFERISNLMKRITTGTASNTRSAQTSVDELSSIKYVMAKGDYEYLHLTTIA